MNRPTPVIVLTDDSTGPEWVYAVLPHTPSTVLPELGPDQHVYRAWVWPENQS